VPDRTVGAAARRPESEEVDAVRCGVKLSVEASDGEGARCAPCEEDGGRERRCSGKPDGSDHEQGESSPVRFPHTETPFSSCEQAAGWWPDLTTVSGIHARPWTPVKRTRVP